MTLNSRRVAPAFILACAFSTWPTPSLATDRIPDAFAFPAVADAQPATDVYSTTITITGIDAAAAISISGAEAAYRINAKAFTTTAGWVRPGDRVRLRVHSTAQPGASRRPTLTIGGIAATWRVTTREPTTPDAFNFPDTAGAVGGAPTFSVRRPILGLRQAAPISIAGKSAAYSINGQRFTNLPGTVQPGDVVRLRMNAVPLVGGLRSALVDIGGVTDRWTLATAYRPSDGFILNTDADSPLPFIFQDGPGDSLFAPRVERAGDGKGVRMTGAVFGGNVDGARFYVQAQVDAYLRPVVLKLSAGATLTISYDDSAGTATVTTTTGAGEEVETMSLPPQLQVVAKASDSGVLTALSQVIDSGTTLVNQARSLVTAARAQTWTGAVDHLADDMIAQLTDQARPEALEVTRRWGEIGLAAADLGARARDLVACVTSGSYCSLPNVEAQAVRLVDFDSTAGLYFGNAPQPTIQEDLARITAERVSWLFDIDRPKPTREICEMNLPADECAPFYDDDPAYPSPADARDKLPGDCMTAEERAALPDYVCGKPVPQESSVRTQRERVVIGRMTIAAGYHSQLEFAAARPPEHGTLEVTDPASGEFAYSPEDGFVGNDYFTFSARNAVGASEELGTVHIEVSEAFCDVDTILVNENPPSDNFVSYQRDGESYVRTYRVTKITTKDRLTSAGTCYTYVTLALADINQYGATTSGEVYIGHRPNKSGDWPITSAGYAGYPFFHDQMAFAAAGVSATSGSASVSMNGGHGDVSGTDLPYQAGYANPTYGVVSFRVRAF